ncbi:MAG: hypothetical protein M5R40_09780 [Anaerolineae bacterium]|nr:hypothetical protein [Anaerolineae bacterium]
MAATLAIAGQRLAHDPDLTAYFDPTCLVQAARLVAGEERASPVHVSLAALEGPVAFLSLVAERDGWRVQGTIKSVLVQATQMQAAQTPAETPPAEGAGSDLGAFAAPEPDVIEVADGGVLVEPATGGQTPALMPTPAAVAFEDFDDAGEAAPDDAAPDAAAPGADAGAPDFMADVAHDVARDTPAGAGDMNAGDQEAGQEAEQGEEAATHDTTNSVLKRRDTGGHPAHFDVPLD